MCCANQRRRESPRDSTVSKQGQSGSALLSHLTLPRSRPTWPMLAHALPPRQRRSAGRFSLALCTCAPPLASRPATEPRSPARLRISPRARTTTTFLSPSPVEAEAHHLPSSVPRLATCHVRQSRLATCHKTAATTNVTAKRLVLKLAFTRKTRAPL